MNTSIVLCPAYALEHYGFNDSIQIQLQKRLFLESLLWLFHFFTLFKPLRTFLLVY